MPSLDDRVFINNDEYYELVGNGIWLMDNHKWSFFIWNSEIKDNSKYLLAHVDYHWDAIYDYWDSPDEEQAFFSADDNEIINIVKENNYIRFDSFICPAIAKGLINEVHFYCPQGDENGDIAIGDNFLAKFNCKQVLHESSKTISKIRTTKPVLFDFCIDVFNRSNEYYCSDILSDSEIENLLLDCKYLVESAEIITISMSYGYSGTESDTKRLTKKTVEMFSKWRNAT